MSTPEVLLEEDEAGRLCRRYAYLEHSVNILVSVRAHVLSA
jgi:hypothetical protein